jgi:hypothetical protein
MYLVIIIGTVQLLQWMRCAAKSFMTLKLQRSEISTGQNESRHNSQ